MIKSSKSQPAKPPAKASYFTPLKHHKWVAISSFTAIMATSAIIAYCLAPPPGYTAKGTLIPNNPPVKFSTIGGAILKQGEKITATDLLADNVIKAVADVRKIDPQQIRSQAKINLSEPEKPLEITVEYRASDRQLALTTAEVLMKAMMEKSRLINSDRWQLINVSLNQRLQQITKDLKQAQQKLNQFQGNDEELTLLEQQVKLQQDLYEKTQAALADAKAAQPEIVSSVAVGQLPQIIAYPGSNPIVPLTLATGLLVGLSVSGGLIPLFAALRQKAARQKEERDRLQAILYRLIEAGNGQITLIRFAMEAQLSAEAAQHYLNKQAEVFNATCEVKKEGSIVYTFVL